MRYLLALLVCVGFLNTSRADDHIVIVFDNSGSMGETMQGVGKTRMQVAKESLTSVMKQVPPTTKVGILTFGQWIYDLQPVDKSKIAAAIQSVRSDCPSGTPLYYYIRAAADRLLTERQKNGNIGSYKMLVVTDGAANPDDAVLNNESAFSDGSPKPGVLNDVVGRGITVDCIGLEIPNDHALKSQINGVYMRGNDPKSLVNAVKKSVAEVGFGQSKDASEDAFGEIAELPELFVVASLKGLTTFRNYAIGEKAPIETTDVQLTSPTAVVATASNGSNFGLFVIGIGAFMLFLFVVAVKLATS